MSELFNNKSKDFIVTKYNDDNIFITVKFDPFDMAEIEDIKRKIRELDLNNNDVVLNLEYIDLINSSVCGIFLVIKKRLKAGKRLILKGVKKEMKGIMKSLERTKLFDCFSY